MHLAINRGIRETPLGTGPYPYNCPVYFEGHYHDCRFMTEHALYQLGKEYAIPIKFLCPERILPKLYVGAQIGIWEGRQVGDGEILEIKTAKRV